MGDLHTSGTLQYVSYDTWFDTTQKHTHTSTNINEKLNLYVYCVLSGTSLKSIIPHAKFYSSVSFLFICLQRTCAHQFSSIIMHSLPL